MEDTLPVEDSEEATLYTVVLQDTSKCTCPILQVHDLRMLRMSPKSSTAIATCLPTVVCYAYLVTYSYRSQVLTLLQLPVTEE